jgi:hypothetical protein
VTLFFNQLHQNKGLAQKSKNTVDIKNLYVFINFVPNPYFDAAG